MVDIKIRIAAVTLDAILGLVGAVMLYQGSLLGNAMMFSGGQWLVSASIVALIIIFLDKIIEAIAELR
jgi:hypothetical protein